MDTPRILLIDDDLPSLMSWGKILRMSGYEPLCASKAEEGLAYALASPLPDMIVCDRTMPGMDGIKVVQVLRENVLTKDIPIIFLTAKVTESERREGMEAGADDYLIKPIHPEVLLKVIQARIARYQEVQQRFEVLKENLSRAIPDYLNNAANGLYGSAYELLEEIREIPDIPPELIALLEDNKESAYSLAVALKNLVSKDFSRILRSS